MGLCLVRLVSGLCGVHRLVVTEFDEFVVETAVHPAGCFDDVRVGVADECDAARSAPGDEPVGSGQGCNHWRSRCCRS